MSDKYSARYKWTSKRVQALRKHMNMTQRQFAEELGTEQQRISEWETGVHHPSRITATLLSMVAERSGFSYAEEKKQPPVSGETLKEFRQRPISELGLKPRAIAALAEAGLTEVGQVLDRLAQGNNQLLAVQDFGRRSLEELKSRLAERGLRY